MFTRLIELNSQQTLLLKGPAEITAERDELTALAKPLKKSESVTIRQGKIMPFETDRVATAKVTLRRGADYLLATGRVGVDIWRSIRDQVFAPDLKCRRVVIVGVTDSGKSTLSTYLLNTALSRGLAVGVIDEDVGQGDLAPPGCIGGKVLREQVFDLRDLEADFFGFVGATSPRGVGSTVLGEVSRVKCRLEGAAVDFYAVNTDGYVAYDGVLSKVGVIREIDPEIVVCLEDLGGGRTLYNRLREECDCNVVLAVRPEYSVKSVSERAGRRLSQYRRFLRGGQVSCIDLRRVGVSFLGRSYPLNMEVRGGSEVVRGDGSGNRLVFRARSLGYVEVIEGSWGSRVVLGLYSLRGMFVGLGSAGEASRLGRCVEVHSDFTVDVLTDSTAGVDTLFLSLIRLRQDIRREYTLPVVKTSL
ncbi:MAG: Clp1/GlmU family protein [Nitrososphaerales archaeon]